MTTCAACGTPDVTAPHLVQRRFTNWSGTWTNAVVCDGREVAGEPVVPPTKPTNYRLSFESRSERLLRARRAALIWAWRGFSRQSALDASRRCDALAHKAKTPKARARLGALARRILDNE